MIRANFDTRVEFYVHEIRGECHCCDHTCAGFEVMRFRHMRPNWVESRSLGRFRTKGEAEKRAAELREDHAKRLEER